MWSFLVSILKWEGGRGGGIEEGGKRLPIREAPDERGRVGAPRDQDLGDLYAESGQT